MPILPKPALLGRMPYLETLKLELNRRELLEKVEPVFMGEELGHIKIDQRESFECSVVRVAPLVQNLTFYE